MGSAEGSGADRILNGTVSVHQELILKTCSPGHESNPMTGFSVLRPNLFISSGME